MSKIRVCAKRPDSEFYMTNILNTLENLQKAVGGYIETYTLPGAVVICNEEGRLQGLKHCCTINGIEFVGNVIITGFNEDGELTDLDSEITLKDIRQWAK